jgi:hypothetical protein
MKTIVTGLAITAIVAAAPALAADLDDGIVVSSIVGKPAMDTQRSSSSTPESGYIAYSDYAAPPAPGCHWTRMPIYDGTHKVIGWRGRPLAACP